MPWGGVLLIVAGVWVCTQVLAGNALGRLGIASGSSAEQPTATGRRAGTGG